MKNTTTLDQEWFDKYVAISGQQDYEWMKEFVKISQQEKFRFYRNEIDNPRYKCHFKKDLDPSISDVDEMIAVVRKSSSNEVVREIYLEKLKELQLRLLMYLNTQWGADDSFFEKSVRLYDRPKKKYFSYIASKVQILLETGDSLPIKSRKRLDSVFSKIDTKSAGISSEVLPPLVSAEEAIDLEAVVDIFGQTLKRYDIEGWEVIIDKEDTWRRFSISPLNKAIYVPGTKALSSRPQALTATGVQAIAEHEIGVHVRRAYEGAKQPLRLLSVGLPGYLIGEEGLASYVQQQIEGATEFYGFDRYLAASLAVGMDGQARDFRSVFALMQDYYLCSLTTDSSVEKKARDAAWDVCVRIFRGTTGNTAGCIFTRDINYFEGNIQMWNLISEKPHIFEELFLGKFNPLNKKQVESLQALGILSQW